MNKRINIKDLFVAVVFLLAFISGILADAYMLDKLNIMNNITGRAGIFILVGVPIMLAAGICIPLIKFLKINTGNFTTFQYIINVQGKLLVLFLIFGVIGLFLYLYFFY
ncbi:MAG: hypothetical protein HQK88_16720 [Nitrospirae bacterium]|nr:hypothetical protein [Nitrospirota bacterium]